MSDPTKRQLLIEWQDPAPNLARAAGMTGLEYMQAMIRGDLIAPPISRLVGFDAVEVGDGYAIFKGIPGEQHFNPLNIVHGSFAMTLLDSATGCAVHTTLPQGKVYGTAQISVNMTRPITPAVGTLICEARVVHRGSRVSTAEGTLKDEQGKLYAHATSTCFIYAMNE